MIFLDLPCGCYHGRQLIRNLINRFREELLRKHGPGRAAGSQKERKLSCCNLLHIVLCFCHRAHIRTDSGFIYIIKAQLLQCCFNHIRCYLRSKLTNKGRCHLRNNLPSGLHRTDQLKDLGFVRDCTKRTAYHTLTAGYTQIRINHSPSLIITLNCIHAAVVKARSYLMGNCIVRTDCLTFTTLNTLLLINNRFAILHGNGTSWTHLTTGMCHTAHTLVRNHITINRAGITCRWNDLHQRRLIILFINITFFQPLCQMNRSVLRSQG